MTAKVPALPQPRILEARPQQPTSNSPAHCSYSCLEQRTTCKSYSPGGLVPGGRAIVGQLRATLRVLVGNGSHHCSASEGIAVLVHARAPGGSSVTHLTKALEPSPVPRYCVYQHGSDKPGSQHNTFGGIQLNSHQPVSMWKNKKPRLREVRRGSKVTLWPPPALTHSRTGDPSETSHSNSLSV